MKRGWFSQILWPVSHYLITNLTITIGYIFFHVFNRTTVIGKKNIPKRPNTLLLSNHQSMIDSFLVGLCAFYPASIFYPSMIPWNPAAAENFFRTPFLSWLAYNWKCIPIKSGRKDVGSIRKMSLALQTSPLILFPEGTRSRDGSIGKARSGAGLVALETHATIVPVYIAGMNKVLPIGSIIPRPFKRIFVYYGVPIDINEFFNQKRTKDVAQAIMDKVMDSIKSLCTAMEKDI